MVKIIADSTCDLSPDLVKRYDISILPLHILLDDEEYLDGQTISPDEIYRWSDASGRTPKTSAPSIEMAEDLMKPYVDAGREIVCFSISDEMSTSGNVMRMAAEELGASALVTVINSQNLSTGIGLLVIEAACMAQKGADAKAIAAQMDVLIPKVRASFVVDTLTYLYRGGRCSGLSALVGGVLKLHPKIVVQNGVMQVDRKYRGKIDGVLVSYAKEMEAQLRAARPERVFITHAGCEEKTIEKIKTYLEQLHVFEEVLVTRAGGVVSSHCGWGTLGVLYIAL